MIDARFRPLDTNQWPRKKTAIQRYGPFRAGQNSTLNLLEKELKHLKARSIVIQIDLPLTMIRNDGWPRAEARPA